MNQLHYRLSSFSLLILTGVVAAMAPQGDPYVVSEFGINLGGGVSSQGDFSMDANVGGDVKPSMSGGDFTLAGNFTSQPPPVLLPCPGDTNIDGSVNVTDLLVLLAGWGPNPGHVADFNDDGNVNVTDLLQLLAAWGACP